MAGNILSQRVASDCARAISGDIGAWLLKNPLPAFIEPKYDGVRVWLVKSGQDMVVATKHNGVYTAKQYPGIFTSLASLEYNQLILDAELMKDPGYLVVFDILHIGKDNVAQLPLARRRTILQEVARDFDQKHVFLIPSTVAKSIEELNEIHSRYVAEDFEGTVIKNPASKYADSDAWLKRKVYETIDCFVTGRDHSHEGYSFYIAGLDKHGERVDMGKVGSFLKSVDCSKIAEGTVVEIQYQEMTRERHLRHPFVIRIRDDKVARECRI